MEPNLNFKNQIEQDFQQKEKKTKETNQLERNKKKKEIFRFADIGD